MASKKITITLAAEQAAKVRELVQTGQASSVSGFVQHAVAVSLQDVAGWGAMLAKALEESGGPLTSRERAWADGIIGPRRTRSAKRVRSTKKRRAA